MASMSTGRASSSSSSSFTPQWTYDVFLSFRGEDTRNNFTDHLYNALKQKGIFTFRDDEKLERGKSISLELSKAIEESRFAIVIFSRNYASSTWCLDELAKIVRCMKEIRMTILPVFYNVNPSDVRKQNGTFAKAFVEHEEHFKENKEKVQKWRNALTEVANISGCHLKDRLETEFIQDIVKVILDKLSYTFSVDTTGLVGMDSRVEKLKSDLAIGLNDIRIIGIWGTGGMGKTTLARAIYGIVSNQFEACSFIADVREVSEKDGLLQLQKKLLNELLMERDVIIHDVDNGIHMIKNRLRHKKILLVLDDVNELDQLKKLAGEHSWFGLGSRVIITTRDAHLLLNHEVNEIYEVEALNDDEALQLFSLKAFKKDQPFEDYVELSQAFVHYSKGLPLALEVLGSFLFNRSIGEWKSKLGRLKEFPERRILNVLQISFDGLQVTEKEIFLNIACFFNHMDQDNVIEILDYLELYPVIGIRVLIDKSLIKFHYNQLWMHDLLQEMGRDIVHQEGPKDLGKRSRLWLYKDIDNVLTKNTGTNAVQGIVLELSEPRKVDWNPEAFSKMQYLKLLIIHNVYLAHDPKHLPSSLRFLDWSGCPLKLLPSGFQSNELVELSMRYSNIERLWKGTKSFEKLKFIHLDGSVKLIETPDFTEVPILEKLVLKDCINLREVHPSIGVKKKLTLLNLKGCKNLKTLPSKLEMDSLKILNLSGCSKIQKIPEFGENMERVLKLYLDGTAITKLPTSIEHLTGLPSLNLRDCKNLVCLPNTISNLKLLKDVNLYGCSKLESLPENLGNAESIEKLDVSGTAIRQVPSSIGMLKKLKVLSFRGRKGLSSSNKSWYEFLPFYSTSRSLNPMDLLSSSLSGLCSLTVLDLRDCNLKTIPNDIGCLFTLKDLFLAENDFVCLPESISQLSNLFRMWVDSCKSLQSLPKLPLNVWEIGARNCISLQMLPDQIKLAQYLYLDNCFKLSANQGFTNMYIAMTKKYLQGVLSPQDYMNIVIPGSEIPEWCSHQSMGAEMYVKEPSHLCNDWIGITVCAVFCSNGNHGVLSWSLIVNGIAMYCSNQNQRYLGTCTIETFKILSDHLWLIYVTPEIFNDEWIKSVWESDVNGFCQIGIRIETEGSSLKVKKCGVRMVYKKDKEDLIRTMAQCSNSNITPYEGLDVPYHNFYNSTTVSESNKVKQNHEDYDKARPSGEGSSNDIPPPKKIERLIEFMVQDNSNCEESSEFKELDVSGTEIRQVPSFIGMLKNFTMQSFRGCKGLSSSNKSWYELLPFYSTPRSPDPMDLLSSSLSSLCSLTILDLRDRNLKAIPSDIDCLFSLKDLFLCGNDFVCLPESISRLSNLSRMWVDSCTSLRSLPKLPLNIWEIGARDCFSLQMLPDQLKLAEYLYLDNCFTLTANQGFTNMYTAMIKKFLQGILSPQDYMNIVIPGSEILKWCSHQNTGAVVYIKEPSHLCNDWIGIVVCAVFCSNGNHGVLSWSLIVNGIAMYCSNKNQRYLGTCTIETFKILSDHLWLIYVTPGIFNDKWIKSVWECNANGSCQIGIRIETKSSGLEVKKCGLRMVYKKDIEDLIPYSNNSITPYEGLDVPYHNFNNSTVVVEANKVKRSHDYYDGAGPSGDGSSNDLPHPNRIERLTEFMTSNSDCEESSEYTECGEELSDWNESSESDQEV